MNERAQNLMGLPLTDLSLTAVASITDIYEDEETGRQLPVVEMEILNQADWDKFNAPKESACRCAMCGHKLKIACAVTHTPTGNGYYIGRDCANKVVALQRFDGMVKGATVALAQRIACDKREADFLAAHPDDIGILTWAKRPNAPRICKDMCEKLRRYGNLSEKQIALLEKIRQADIDRRAKATDKAKAGRQAIQGIVRKVTVEDSEFRNNAKITKLIVDLGTGVRLMGNAPEYIVLTEVTIGSVPDYMKNSLKVGNETFTHEVLGVGDTVVFTATVKPSDKDDLFGFWKRPTGFVITAKAPKPAEVNR